MRTDDVVGRERPRRAEAPARRRCDLSGNPNLRHTGLTGELRAIYWRVTRGSAGRRYPALMWLSQQANRGRARPGGAKGDAAKVGARAPLLCLSYAHSE